jgi:hypothetical protein
MAAAMCGLVLPFVGAFPCANVAECMKTPLYMIPGNNPIVAPAPGGWSSKECEMAGGVFQRDDKSYVMVYHCLTGDNGYNVGMSTADHPLGPWSQPAPKPVLAISPDSWDSDSVRHTRMGPGGSRSGRGREKVKRGADACATF